MVCELPQGHEYRRISCTACGATFDVPISCGNRFCEICNSPRRRRIQSKLSYIIQNATIPKGYRWRFVTLTVPRSDDLFSTSKSLIASFRRLRQRSFWSKRVAGGAYVIEVVGTPGNWFAHLHVLVLSAYLPQKQLATAWSKCSPGKIVYIQLIPVKAIVNYVTKYVTKSDLAPEHQIQASDSLKGSRLFQPFGSLHLLSAEAPKLLFACKSCGNEHFIPTSYSDIPWLSRNLVDIDGFPDPWKGQEWEAKKSFG